ncbi:MAG: M48 family metallopeptidase [Parcubacteria group bacterium]|nr:M48 family metallopeptidase [Parcubacteria group bacterium]
MATLYTHKSSNIRKTWLLISLFLILIIFIGWVVSLAFQNPAILYIAVAFSLVMNILAFWFSDKIALSIARAKPVERRELPELYNVVENLSIAAGLPMPRLYIINEPQLNAFATGRNPKNSAVAVTTGALAKLNRTELEGVLAHELSHIGNRDILVSTIAVVLSGVIAMVADIFLRMLFWSSNERRGGPAVLIAAIAAAILAPFAAMLLRLAVSRKREFLADASGALLTRYPEGLASALEKISNDSNLMRSASDATAHLYISNPFKGKERASWFVKLFLTHPPIEERIKILRGLKQSDFLL